MKASLHFNLDDEFDRQAHLRCTKSEDIALALWSLTGEIRSSVDRSEDGKTIDGEALFNAMTSCMSMYNINLDELIS